MPYRRVRGLVGRGGCPGAFQGWELRGSSEGVSCLCAGCTLAGLEGGAVRARGDGRGDDRVFQFVPVEDLAEVQEHFKHALVGADGRQVPALGADVEDCGAVARLVRDAGAIGAKDVLGVAVRGKLEANLRVDAGAGRLVVKPDGL